MVVTLAGMVTEVKFVVTMNAPSPMLVTPDGMLMEVKPERANALYSMLVTPDGIVMEVKLVLLNALPPMLVS